MPQYYQNQQRAAPMQQRPMDGGSVRLARERAQAMAQREMYEREEQMNWSSTSRSDRNYAAGAATRPMMNNAPYREPQMAHSPPRAPPNTFYSNDQRSATSSFDDLTEAVNQQRGRGEMAQDFRFPSIPKPVNSAPQSTRRYQGNQQRAQAPPQPNVVSPAWPLPKADRAQTSQAAQYGMQRNAMPTRPQQTNPYERESVYSRPSEPGTPPTPQGIFRQASQGKKAKPVLTTIRSPEIREKQTNVNSPRASTVNALSAAITAGMAPTSRPQTPQSQAKSSPMRMPFAEDSPPGSPLDEDGPLEPPRGFGRSPLATPESINSARSHNPLLGADPRPAMSDRIPSTRRPPRLNIEAVREAESRGSTTSLAELIRRATKLASNLDRGKTASRLGMLDMFNISEKDDNRKSGSLADMLSAFPEPGMTPTSAQAKEGRDPLGASHLRDGELATRDSIAFRGDKPKGQRCCGMSLPVFFIVMLILVILIAAAVLVPMFLIVIPRMQNSSTSLAHCSTSHVCQNLGISLVSDNKCSCVCTDGYTGDHCQLPLDADCSVASVSIDQTVHTDATAGSSIPDVLNGANNMFRIPLNSTALMSLFAANNLSCATENSLVSFNVPSTNQKRFLPIHLPLPTDTPSLHVLHARVPQSSTVASSNGIVFQASTTSSASTTLTATPISTDQPSGTQTTSSPAAAATTSNSPVLAKTLSFAQVVVLYVFEHSSSLSIAVNAQQTVQSYLANAGGEANGTLSVGYQDLHISADFADFIIKWANGTSVGGMEGGKLRRRREED